VLVERAGYSPAEALTMATSTAAAALGLEDRVGSITPGKLADLVLIAGDPLRDIRCAGRVARVYQQGRPVWSVPPGDDHQEPAGAHTGKHEQGDGP
jgi:imidazolonepropionase-like amidohydrolase